MGVAINTKIDTFTNNGFINSPGSGQWNNGIWISSNATIEKLVNNGTIKRRTFCYNGNISAYKNC